MTVEAGPAPEEVGPVPAPAPETGLGPKRLLPEAGELMVAVCCGVDCCLRKELVDSKLEALKKYCQRLEGWKVCGCEGEVKKCW